MLCGLGTAIFATSAAANRVAFGALLLGFAGGAAVIRPPALPPPAWTGCTVAVVAAIYILRPGATVATAFCGGLLAAILNVLLQIQGLTWMPALILSGIVPALAVYLTRRLPAFAPEALRQEAMLVIIALGLAVAIIPEISAGWQSALVLNRSQAIGAEQFVANWVFVLIGVSVLLGGCFSLLRRR